MQMGRIIPGSEIPLIPTLGVEILQRVILLGRKTKHPEPCRTGRNARLIDAAHGKALIGLAVHGPEGCLILIIEGAAMLIDHDAVIVQGTVAVAIELPGKKPLRMAEGIRGVVDDQVILVTAAAQETQAVGRPYS